jgi:predicted nucleic acid-binding protein
MEGAKRLVFDTSIYIGAIRGGLFSPTFRMLQETLPRTYLSSVVSAELLAGATNPAARRAVMDFVRRAHRVRRVVTPDTRTWERAGERLGEIRQDNPHLRPRIKTFWNDVLIAMSAKQAGAMVVTQNAQDFQLLQRHIPFELHILALDIHRSFA